MSWRSWLDARRQPWRGEGGRPPSGNGASSFHLFWAMPPGRWTAVEATLEVLQPPATPVLYFWALQASFAGAGSSGGAGHLGLQWLPPGPQLTSVNWGGYDGRGSILDGSVSALPSRSANANTRDYRWSAAVPYRLRIEAAGPAPDGRRHAFRGSVQDLASGEITVVRDLWAGGDRLDGAMVWSEVFAPCDGPATAVRWSDFGVVAEDGSRVAVHAVTVNYQSLADGGCVTTDVTVDGAGLVQRTATARSTAQGARLSTPG